MVPEDGSLLWEDASCLRCGGPNPDNAHAFIKFILAPEVHGAIAEFVRYPCPNAAAMEYIPEADSLGNHSAIYPAREVLERCEFALYMGEQIEGLYTGRADPGARRLTRAGGLGKKQC